MWNGDSGYGAAGAASVTGADKPGGPPLLWWIFPVVVWRP
jgi:hypothetical protein